MKISFPFINHITALVDGVETQVIIDIEDREFALMEGGIQSVVTINKDRYCQVGDRIRSDRFTSLYRDVIDGEITNVLKPGKRKTANIVEKCESGCCGGHTKTIEIAMIDPNRASAVFEVTYVGVVEEGQDGSFFPAREHGWFVTAYCEERDETVKFCQRGPFFKIPPSEIQFVEEEG